MLTISTEAGTVILRVPTNGLSESRAAEAGRTGVGELVLAEISDLLRKFLAPGRQCVFDHMVAQCAQLATILVKSVT